MTPPPVAAWAAIINAPVIGRVGHRRTQEPGPTHLLLTTKGKVALPAPAWVRPHGCDLKRLHAAHNAHLVHERRGEDRECQVGSVRRRKLRRPKPAPVLQLARRSA